MRHEHIGGEVFFVLLAFIIAKSQHFIEEGLVIRSNIQFIDLLHQHRNISVFNFAEFYFLLDILYFLFGELSFIILHLVYLKVVPMIHLAISAIFIGFFNITLEI